MTPIPKPLVVVAGTFQRGKSTLINGLIGRAVAEVGEGIATTHGWTRYRQGKQGDLEALSPDGIVQHRWPGLPSSILSHVDLADIPGFNAAGAEGHEDTERAKEALAHADIVLHVTDQTGLGGEAERAALKSIQDKHPTLVSLQNVFGRWSKDKRTEFLRILDKQLDNLGVIPWHLNANTQVLTINALRFAQAAGVAPSDSEAPETPSEAAKWRAESGVAPLIEFLTSGGPHGLGAVELCALRRATTQWATQRVTLINQHLDNFITSCQ